MLAVAACLVAAPALLQAQTVADCRLQTQDACQKAEDIYTYLFPQLGVGLAAGNPVLGLSRAGGGLGHFSVGVRVSAVKADVPDFDNIAVGLLGRENTDIPLTQHWTPVPVFDASVGLFRGFQVGVTHLGSVDALASLTVVPSLPVEESDLRLEGTSRFGLGVQIGLLEESVAIPGISFAFLQRGLPKVTANSQANTPATFSVEDLDVTVSTWRLIVNKNFLAFALSAGVGGDRYESTGILRATAAGFTEEIHLDRAMNRINWFVDLTLNLGPVKLGAEYGGITEKDATTFNTFDPVAGAARTYFAVGLRLGL
jgi:hypothetical protein